MMKFRSPLPFLAFTALTLTLVAPVSPNAAPARKASRSPGSMSLEAFEKRPKLVVVLVIDQFRSDYLTRFSSRFLPAKSANGDVGGFRYLMANGAFYPAARYDVLQSMTCPGHAMILSGSYPYMNGINLNEWYDPKRGKLSYCAYDPDSPLVGASNTEDDGVSPKNLIGSTVGDELKNAGHSSRVVAVALKDRSAIFLGGHRADSAIWLSKGFQWVTSRHYAKDGQLPKWVDELNDSLKKRKGETVVWSSKEKESGLSNAFESGEFSRTTTFGTKDSLRYSPGVEITVDAALAASRAYKLGQRTSPDVLAISFSTHDMLGHDVGPNAREMEEMTIVEDRAIARLLNGLRKSMRGGLADTVVVLTGDHGVSPDVDYLKAAGVPAGRMEDDDLLQNAEKAMVAKFGPSPTGKWMAAVRSFNFYFDRDALAKKDLASATAEDTVKAALLAEPGAAFVFGRSDRAAGKLPPGQHERQIAKSYIASKSGDVVLIPKPFFMEKGAFTTHMTGYAYDRSVPIVITGRNVRPGVRAEAADVVDIAPTLSFLLGVLAPATSEGRVLSESLGD